MHSGVFKLFASLRIKSDKVPTGQSSSQKDLLILNAKIISKTVIPITMDVGVKTFLKKNFSLIGEALLFY